MNTLKWMEDPADAPRNRIGGYLVVWGSAHLRDLHGEYFSPETDLGLDWYAARPLLYHHGLDPHVKAAPIGVIDRLIPDEVGVWAEGVLDQRSRYLRHVRDLIDQGALGWSSGSMPHLVEVGEDGHIRRWIIAEGSITPTPAEPRMTNVYLLHSAEAVAHAYRAIGADPAALRDPAKLGDADRLRPAVFKTALPDTLSSPIPSTRPSQEPALMTQHDTAPNLARKRLPLPAPDAHTPLVAVGSPYDSLDAFDMLHGYMLLRHGKAFQGVSERYAHALGHKLSRSPLAGAIKADELNRSTLTGYGDEWVPDLWSAQIWAKARAENTVLGLLNSIDMPSNPYELPVEGADASVFYVPETADENALTLGTASPIPDSRMGTGKVQLVARKLGLRVGITAELVEDSIVPVLSMYREQAVRAILDSIDYVLLNGDTTTTATGNINKDHAAPAASDRFLIFDGLRRMALVTNTTQRVDAANTAPTLASLRSVRFKLDPRYSTRPSDLAWIVDAATYAKMTSMAELMTVDKIGPQATVLTGQIGSIDGSPVLVSAEMPTTGANGKIGATGNDRGTALVVYRPGWTVGYKRRVSVSVDYLSYYDTYQLTATVRLAFAPIDNRAVAVGFNYGV
jgi:HK97 family phage major capsid protein